MKRNLILIFIFINSYLVFSQQPQWVFKVNYEATGETIDSVIYFTKVFMDVNPAVLLDSAMLVLSISSNTGANDIYYRSVVFTPTIANGTDITNVDGIIRFYMGKYMIIPTSPFIVDLEIKPKGTGNQ